MIPLLRPGSRLDRYQLVRPLGRGGFGQVWEAVRDGDGGRVALKVAAGGLGSEARLTARLRHRHLLDVYDVGEEDGWSWYAMELCPEGSLERLVPLPPRAVVEAGIAVCEALSFAHEELGVVHADVKPENLLVAPDGSVRLADLGQAVVAGTRTRTGTPAYASPEQRAGRPVHHPSDIYALGLTLAVLATGSSTVVARTVALEEDEPTADLTPSVPAWLEGVVSKATHPDPSSRPTAEQLEVELRRLEVGGASLAEVLGSRRTTSAPLPLVGRRAELAAVAESSRPTLVSGPVGVGKSRLLAEVAALLAGRGHDVVRLDGAAPTGVVAAAAEALGLRGLRGRDLDSAVGALLARRQAAVVVDPLPDDSALRAVLSSWHAAGVFVVAAARSPQCPDSWAHVTLGLLGEREGAEVARAVAARRGVTVSQPDAEALSRALDGLPFAIELAASRLGVWTVADLLASHSVRDLRAPSDGGRSALEVALESAWSELDGPQQSALSAAAQFVAGFSAEALEEVGGPGSADRLVELGARAMALDDGSGRWRLLEVVRSFAEPRAARAVRERFVGWALGWASKSVHVDERTWPLVEAAVQAELAHLPRAVDVARELGDLALAVRLVEHVGWLGRALLPEDLVLEVAERLLADPGLSPPQRHAVERRIVRALLDVHHVDAVTRATEHLGRCRAQGTPEDIGHAEMLAGVAMTNFGDLAGAAVHHQRALTLFAPGSLNWAHAQLNLGLAVRHDYPRATELTRLAAAVYTTRRKPRWSVASDLNLGLYAHLAGRLEEACEHYQRALSSPFAYGALRVQVQSNLGAIAFDEGHGPASREAFRATIELATALGLSDDVEMMRANVAASWLGEDDDEAVAVAESVVASPRARPVTRSVAHHTLAHAWWRRRDDGRAWRHLDLARRCSVEVVEPLLWALMDPSATLPEKPPSLRPGDRASWACLLWRFGRHDDALAAAAELRTSPDKALFAHVQARFPRPAPR